MFLYELFQTVNRGVSSAFLEKVKKEVQEFFNLSMEEKKKYWQCLGDVEGFGQSKLYLRNKNLIGVILSS